MARYDGIEGDGHVIEPPHLVEYVEERYRSLVLLPKTSSGVTECDSCASGRRDVRVPNQAPACTIPTEVSRARLEAENLI